MSNPPKKRAPKCSLAEAAAHGAAGRHAEDRRRKRSGRKADISKRKAPPAASAAASAMVEAVKERPAPE